MKPETGPPPSRSLPFSQARLAALAINAIGIWANAVIGWDMRLTTSKTGAYYFF
jgi:hypothetical protein